MNTSNDEPNYELAGRLIEEARVLASTQFNTLYNLTPEERESCSTLRVLFANGLSKVGSYLNAVRAKTRERLDVSESDIISLNQSCEQALSHYRILEAHTRSRLDLPPRAMEKALAEISGSLPSGGDALKDFLQDFRRRNGSRCAFYARVLRAGLLLEQCAVLCDVAVTREPQSAITKRSITFPPEFKQAGIAILSYFSNILNSKYPTMNVAVTIEQQGEKVVLIIETPAGERETIERELAEYGKVVVGDLTAEEYLHNPQQVIALKHKLELAALEHRHTLELLQSERTHYGERIRSLEDQTRLLREMLDKGRDGAAEISLQLRELISHTTSAAEASLQVIIKLIDKGLEKDETENLERHLAEIKSQDASLFAKVEAFIIKGAIQGAAGNYLYAALQAISRMP
jgi:hypothetical protein